MPRRFLWCVLFAVASGAQLLGQNQDTFNRPFPPHKVIGNVYYVGSGQLASFLITTPGGHILVNSSFESTVPVSGGTNPFIDPAGFKAHLER